MGKLVRDKIPAIIEADGKSCILGMLDELELVNALRAKLIEEVNEYLDATTYENAIEELADIMEVIYTLCRKHGANPKILEDTRIQKFAERGGFDDGVYLEEVIEN